MSDLPPRGRDHQAPNHNLDPNRLVIEVEGEMLQVQGIINVSFVRNHEAVWTVRVPSGPVVAAPEAPPRTTRRTSGTSSNAGLRNQSIPDDIALPSNTQEYYRCPICFGSSYANMPRATSCGHVYCAPCLLECLGRRAKCPICGVDQHFDDSIPLFF